MTDINLNSNMRIQGILQWQTLKLLKFLRTLRLTQPSVKNMGIRLSPNVFTTRAVAFGDCTVNDIWQGNLSGTCGR
jgi:hypothetical protein